VVGAGLSAADAIPRPATQGMFPWMERRSSGVRDCVFSGRRDGGAWYCASVGI